jgi:hypothetical protein
MDYRESQDAFPHSRHTVLKPRENVASGIGTITGMAFSLRPKQQNYEQGSNNSLAITLQSEVDLYYNFLTD